MRFAFFCSFFTLYFSKDGFDLCLVAVYYMYVYRSSARISADRNTLLSPIEFSSAGIEIGVWINSAGLINLGRPKFELDSAHVKYGV